MTTERITLTADPVQITTGTETAFADSVNGAFRFVDADSKPTDLTVYHVKTEISVTPPFQIWAWSPFTGVSLIVTRRETA